VGRPWAIGAAEGGHKSVHPELGTLEDFKHLVRAAAERRLELALDLAFQCSPDHPYIREHPEWFSWRPDGTLKTAENPPKRYQDIVNFDFMGRARESLWQELKSVVLFWIDAGVKIFRVDNPHTKPLPFWAWLISEVQSQHPEVIFLAEAFTRPKLMMALAKVGFTQSYTYFTWRNFKHELEDYFQELTHGPEAEYMRGNLWPATPDILPARRPGRVQDPTDPRGNPPSLLRNLRWLRAVRSRGDPGDRGISKFREVPAGSPRLRGAQQHPPRGARAQFHPASESRAAAL